jgi:hypothetical protein
VTALESRMSLLESGLQLGAVSRSYPPSLCASVFSLGLLQGV